MLHSSDSIISAEAQTRSTGARVANVAPVPGAVQKPAQHSATDDPNLLLGRLAIHYKVLTRLEVMNALAIWRSVSNKQDFGTFLITKKYLDQKTLDKLEYARDNYLQQQKGPSVTAPVASSKAQQAYTPVTETRESKLALVPDSAAQKGQPSTPSSEVVKAFKTADKFTVTPLSTPETSAKDSETDLLSYAPGVSLRDLLQQTIELNASDLHIHSGASLRIRLNGEIREATPAVLTSNECKNLINDVLNDSQRKKLEENFQVDFAYEIPGVGRYRANVYQQRRGIDAVFRTIQPTPPSLIKLGLPMDLKQYTELHQGLVLFTGPAGCGKSSTMAAMVNLVNKSRSDHILTIEDPIEYVHNSESCSVNQRETGVHTESFSKALRAALREDPDVIVIGELRDLETISLALTAAETGHLVMATLHTSSAIRTVNRLLGVFPPDQQAQVRMMLSESLKVVISQRLVQRADGRGQVAALEVMINNQAIGNLIRENRTFQIKSIMQTGGAQGQQLLDATLAKLLKKRVITKEEAIRHAEDPDNFV